VNININLRSIYIISVCLIIRILVLPIPSHSIDTDTSQAVTSFKHRVKLFNTFFSNRPHLIIKANNSESPTGVVYAFYALVSPEIYYDVKQTQSLINPIIGYIRVSFIEKIPNDICKDFTSKSGSGFTTLEKARISASKYECSIIAPYQKPEILFIFTFNKNKWVFQELKDLNSTMSFSIMSDALGLDESFPDPDNSSWKILIK
jgi:hypothetical protein